MAISKKEFYNNAVKKATDKQHYHKLKFNINQYNENVAKGLQQYNNLEAAKQYAKNVKANAIDNLDILLTQFEENFTKNGGAVLWAETVEQAQEHILEITNKHKAKTIVKSKSVVVEELALNQFLEKRGLEIFETDLGNYIIQLAGEKPYHMVTPAIHKTKEDVQQLFHQKLGTAPDLTAQQLTKVMRDNLREKYAVADIGITGANFLIANTGSIALTENEGNEWLTSAYPKVHVAIAGIEDILPAIKDVHIFWPLLASHSSGQHVATYNSILSGPKTAADINGPEYMYVILLDNGRTKLLAKQNQREALHCINCGACLNACPVYQTIGGHSYGFTYGGPIGSVMHPNLNASKQFNHLSEASAICGKCTEVCPVKIDLHNQLLYNRRDAQLGKKQNFKDRLTWNVWRKAMLNRNLMNTGQGIKNLMLRFFFKAAWGNKKDLPKVKKSFNQQWKKHQKNK